MERFKIILEKMFLLPPLPTVLAALFGYGSVLIVAIFRIEVPLIKLASYFASAYALIITITGLPYLKLAVEKIKRYIFLTH